jgi:tetratricopeptide (TPR) repeat protein
MSTTNQQLKAVEKSIQLAGQKLKEGDTDLAFRHIQEGIQIDGSNLRLLEIATNVYLKLNDQQKAIQYAKKIIFYHPKDPCGYIKHAQGLLISGHADEAHEIAISALTQFPDNPQLLGAASEACRALSRWEESLILANQLIKCQPNFHLGYLKAAQALIGLNKAKEACSIAQRGLNTNPNHSRLHSIASDAYRARHKHNQSIYHSKILIKIEPDSIEGHKRAAQDLLKLGQRDEAISIIEQLIQRNKSKQASEIAVKLFTEAGQASRSLVLTTKLAKENKATDEDKRQWISSLFSCRQIDFTLSIIERNESFRDEKESSTLRDLLTKPFHTSKRLSDYERQLITHYGLYPHLSTPNFNPTNADLEYQLASNNKIILIVIHVGKCAGESIITALKETFTPSEAEVIEYHIFDSNVLIKEVLPLLHRNSDRVHITICTRNPRDRWISSYNWDHHTFFLSNQFYCPDRAIQLHRQYRSALKLIGGLMRDEAEAHELASFKHLTYGHMARGISWYLPKNIFEDLSKLKISIINVETIHNDFEHCVDTIMETFKQMSTRKPAVIAKTKQNYQQWYNAGKFSAAKQLNSVEKLFLDGYLNNDYAINLKLNKIQ